VNHHLFFADLGIKQPGGARAGCGNPAGRGVVIFDEAHELEDVAGSYFGISVSAARLEDCAATSKRLLQRNKQLHSFAFGRD